MDSPVKSQRVAETDHGDAGCATKIRQHLANECVELAFIYVRSGHGRTSFDGCSLNHPFHLAIQQKQIGGRKGWLPPPSYTTAMESVRHEGVDYGKGVS